HAAARLGIVRTMASAGHNELPADEPARSAGAPGPGSAKLQSGAPCRALRDAYPVGGIDEAASLGSMPGIGGIPPLLVVRRSHERLHVVRIRGPPRFMGFFAASSARSRHRSPTWRRHRHAGPL